MTTKTAQYRIKAAWRVLRGEWVAQPRANPWDIYLDRDLSNWGASTATAATTATTWTWRPSR